MGNLTWTKTWSSSDAGTILTGAHLGQLQADIAAIVNGGISNVNIAADAAVEESKMIFDTASGHNHDGDNSRAITNNLKHFISGAELIYVSASTVKANMGAIYIDGVTYNRDTFSSTLDLTDSGDWLYGSEPTDGWIYIYAYNDTGISWDIKLSTQAPQYANCGTSTDGSLRYRQYNSVWYRCIGAIRNTSGDLVKFYQNANDFFWDLTFDTAANRALAGGTNASFTDVDLSAYCPAISRLAKLTAMSSDTGGTDFYLRTNGATGSGKFFTYEAQGTVDLDLYTDASQVIEYKIGSSGGTLSIWCVGFSLGGIR